MGCFGVPLEKCLFTPFVKLFHFLDTLLTHSAFVSTLILICLQQLGDKIHFDVCTQSKQNICFSPKRANRYYIQIYESCLMRLWCTGKRFVGCKMFSCPMDTYEMTFLSLTSWSKAVLNIEMPCSWHEAMPASSECSFEFGWCRCVGVLLFLSLTFFFSLPISFSEYCACCGSRTLCNAYKSTSSGEVPLRHSLQNSF